MKILLFQPIYGKIVKDTTSIPLGLASLATYLQKAGLDVSCYDESIEGTPSMKFFSKFELIGIQFHSFESYEESVKILKRIRSCSNAITVAGGVVATFYREELMKIPELDYIILNEGEKIFLKLIDNLKKGKDVTGIDGLIINKINLINEFKEFESNLDCFPIPERGFFKWEKYKQWSIVTSRGCPYRCKFCSIPSFWKNTYRQRSPDNIYNEIEYLVKTFDVKKIFILDDTFTIHRSNTIRLLKLLRNARFNLEWACLTRADLLDEELLSLMKETGCSTISLGVESANQDTLDYLNKNIVLSVIKNAIDLIKKNNIRVRCSYIFGFPNETFRHLENNINFILETEPDEVQIYPLFPYLGTELYKKEVKLSDLYAGKDALSPVYETEKLSKQIISWYVQECVQKLKLHGYNWLSSYEIFPHKSHLKKVVMTEFAPIQALE